MIDPFGPPYPSDQAHAPKGHIWRKPSEGLSYGCMAKGAHSGSGGRVAKFMVAVSYGNGSDPV